MPTFQIFNHDELTTPTYQVTLLDEAGAPIPDLDLDTDLDQDPDLDTDTDPDPDKDPDLDQNPDLDQDPL